MYKSNVGDFPLKDYPCEYWWVRYAVACSFFTDSHQKIWRPKIDEMKNKHNFDGFSYRGTFDIRRARTKEGAKAFLEAEIFIWKNGKQVKLNPIKDKELWDVLRAYIRTSERGELTDCPYEMDKQSKCPFYKQSEFYKDIPLEELRQRKGYNL